MVGSVSGRRTRRGCLIGSLSAVGIVGAAGVGLIAVVAHDFSLFGDFGRKHLKQIPVAASACPYVRALHAAANAVQSTEPVPAIDLRPNAPQGTTVEWRPTRARFDQALATLELAILVSDPHVPRRVRHYLNVTLGDVRVGRAELATARDVDIAKNFSQVFDDGQLAYGFAGDLVGRQCKVPLRADDSTQPNAFIDLITAPPVTTTLP